MNITEKIKSLEGKACEVKGFGLIKVSPLESGKEARDFLQNMSTNDFDAVGEDTASPGAFCNAKGRVIANFITIRKGSPNKAPTYYLALPEDLVTKVIEHLQKFKLMTKVDIADVSEKYRIIGLTPTIIYDLPCPPEELRFELAEDGCISALIYILKEQYAGRWEVIGGDSKEIKLDSWHLYNVLQKFIWVRKATSEKMIPQSLNLDLTGAVSFNKGCYPGQEIVARMHYLGKLKKRTYQFCAFGEYNFEIGANIYIEGQDAPCGTVIDSACSGGATYALAMVNIKDKDHGLKLRSPQSGRSLGICDTKDTENYENSFDPEAKP